LAYARAKPDARPLLRRSRGRPLARTSRREHQRTGPAPGLVGRMKTQRADSDASEASSRHRDQSSRPDQSPAFARSPKRVAPLPSWHCAELLSYWCAPAGVKPLRASPFHWARGFEGRDAPWPAGRTRSKRPRLSPATCLRKPTPTR